MSGYCPLCKKTIPPDELVFKLKNNLVYHVDCLKCVQCKGNLKTGDYVVILDPTCVLCVDDYKKYWNVETFVHRLLQFNSQ